MCAHHFPVVLRRSRLGETTMDPNWNDLFCFGGTSCCAAACTSNAVTQSDVCQQKGKVVTHTLWGWVTNGCLKVTTSVAPNLTLHINSCRATKERGETGAASVCIFFYFLQP